MSSRWKRWVNPSIRVTPADSQAAAIASQSATVGAIGFSSRTWAPAAAIAATTGRWSAVGTHTLTTSGRASASIAGRVG